MALFRKFFYRKPPDGLLEITERVYVFDCCFTTDILEDVEYKVYMGGIVRQLRDHLPDASFMVFNFREGEKQSLISTILSDYDMTVMDYPRHYESCPVLTMEMIHHFLRSSESWLLLGHQNVLLMHCERGGWPVLAFMLSALLIYRKQYTAEQKTLDMVYKQAPRELLQYMSPMNPLPSQLRYLQYVSRRNLGSEWPPLDRALTLDCIILRFIPVMDGEGGCRPIFRIYGQDPFIAADRTPKVLFSTPKRSKAVRHYKQAECELVKIDIHCHIIGDVVLECITLDEEQEREVMMFRFMFNTAFIRSNILMLNRDEVDTLWNVKDQFPTDFRTEILFSEMNASTALVTIDLPGVEEKEGLPVEAFAKVQEIFSSVDWLDSETDIALNMLQQMTASNFLNEKLDSLCTLTPKMGNVLLESTREKVTEKLNTAILEIRKSTAAVLVNELTPSPRASLDANSTGKKIKPQELQFPRQLQAQPKIISPGKCQSPLSSPVLHSNSPQGSPGPISRYHSAPSALGITALLHDHATSDAEEVARLVKTSTASTATSKSCVAKSETNIMPIRPQTPSPPPPGLAIPPTPSCQLASNSETTHSSLPEHAKTLLNEKGRNSLLSQVSELPPSLSGPSSIKKPFSPPPPPPSPTFFSGAFPSSAPMPPPPPPPPPKFPSSVSPPPLPPPPLQTWPTSHLTVTSSAPPLPPPLPGGLPGNQATKYSPNAPPAPPPPALPSKGSSLDGGVSPHFNSAGVNANVPPQTQPTSHSTVTPSAPPPPPPPPGGLPENPASKVSPKVPPVPAPPAPPSQGLSKAIGAFPHAHSAGNNGNGPPLPGPPPSAPPLAKGRGQPRLGSRNQGQTKKNSLKPYHWLKLTRAVQGSLWAETQKSDEASKAPEFDMLELESLFSAIAPNSDPGRKSNRRSMGPKSDKVHLIELRRAYNCEIMLSKVKIPLSDLMNSVLILDDTALDADQVDNLIKFSPTKEEMELLKGYNGDKENLGKCEQFFLELMKVPRVESKLRVFSFKMQFCSQVSDLRTNLNIVNSVADEIRDSAKLKRIMQTILSLGNALNHGTARGSAIGFRLDSLLKLTDTRARNNKMTLMHYLCKVLADKLPELLDFQKDLGSLEASTKIQLKYLAEEMQAISKGLEKVVQELTASENDGPVSESFCKILKDFLGYAEAEVRSLASLYSGVGRNADALAHYFGEDPARCPFEQVVSTLRNFVKTFSTAHQENCRQLEFEKRKALKEAQNEDVKVGTPKKVPDHLISAPLKSGDAR